MWYDVLDTSGETAVLSERVYYDYQGEGPSKGHPTRVVHATIDPQTQEPVGYAAADLTYNHQGELWFVTQSHWAAGEYCEGHVRDRITEFKGSGRARYLTRQHNPAEGME